jgi:putative two-component system response regulator
VSLGYHSALATSMTDLNITGWRTQVHHLRREIDRTCEMLVESWVRTLHQRDRETADHTRRVTDWTLRIARELGLPQSLQVHIRRGALLHDIGKLWIPDQILQKPGPLSPDEWVVMRQHPVYARDLMFPVEALRPAIDIPYCHHERWDGKGYPQGLAGNAIPLSARIFTIVDVWDALRADRPYHRARSVEEARVIIAESAGNHFDPALTALFLKLIDEPSTDVPGASFFNPDELTPP